MRFVVRADLMCEPLNVPVEFVADLELDSGNISVGRI
jgi:type VI secretion system protein ImpF